MKVTVDSPVRADHRIIRRLISATYGGKVDHKAEEYEIVTKVFKKAGGSWHRLFLGSTRDIGLLKKILRVAYTKGHLTRTDE